jgi:hypothetical protein
MDSDLMSTWSEVRADAFDAEKPTVWWGDAAWMVIATWALMSVALLLLPGECGLFVVGLLVLVPGGIAISHAHGAARRRHWARVAHREPDLPRRSLLGIAIGELVVNLPLFVLFWGNESALLIGLYATLAIVPTVGWAHGRRTVRRQTAAKADTPE